MTRNETKELIKKIMIAYPSFKPQDLTATVDMWSRMFENESFSNVIARLEGYIAINKFAPSIADLKKPKKKNDFANFDQREFSSTYFDELERELSNWNN